MAFEFQDGEGDEPVFSSKQENIVPVSFLKSNYWYTENVIHWTSAVLLLDQII